MILVGQDLSYLEHSGEWLMRHGGLVMSGDLINVTVSRNI